MRRYLAPDGGYETNARRSGPLQVLLPAIPRPPARRWPARSCASPSCVSESGFGWLPHVAVRPRSSDEDRLPPEQTSLDIRYTSAVHGRAACRRAAPFRGWRRSRSGWGRSFGRRVCPFSPDHPAYTCRARLGSELEVPLAAHSDEAKLLARLRTGKSSSCGGGRWTCFAVDELHETKDAGHLGRRRALVARCGRARVLISSIRTARKLASVREQGGSPQGSQVASGRGITALRSSSSSRRLAAVARTFPVPGLRFALISRATDSRTVRACLVPPEHFLVKQRAVPGLHRRRSGR